MRWRDCIERDMRKAELEDVDWRMVAQDIGTVEGRPPGDRDVRVATLTPEIREKGREGRTVFTVSFERHWQNGVNGIAKVRSEVAAAGFEPKTIRSPVRRSNPSATPPHDRRRIRRSSLYLSMAYNNTVYPG